MRPILGTVLHLTDVSTETSGRQQQDDIGHDDNDINKEESLDENKQRRLEEPVTDNLCVHEELIHTHGYD